jgi:hypothetical protein
VGTPDWVRSLTAEMAPMPELWNRLLALHVADSSGRCCACTTPGTGAPAAHWPCAIYLVAQQARQRHDDLTA